MIDKDKIREIVKLAAEEAWPFPKTFDSLKEAGVVSCEASWHDGCFNSLFNLVDSTSFADEKISGLENIKVAAIYLASQAKNALLVHQQGKTTFIEWVHEMANAGVASYKVLMSNRTVHYFSFDRSQTFVEKVPAFK